MQDRYAGDIGDFAKIGLLRSLVGNPPGQLRLGVAWWWMPADRSNGDGKFTDYLTREGATFRPLDVELFDGLAKVAHSANRSVSLLESSGLFASDTRFHRESPPWLNQRFENRSVEVLGDHLRRAWVDRALEATNDCDLVFLDPDNGISGSANPFDQKGGKFVFVSEIERFIERGQSAVVYHHLGRDGNHDNQATRWLAALRRALPAKEITSFRWSRRSPRLFFVIVGDRQRQALSDRLERFRSSEWCRTDRRLFEERRN